MTNIEFWKNFRLGTELQISGAFLYNAIYCFDRMSFFYFEEECFEFLYHSSVGLERLQKIVIVLSEHNENVNQVEFEKSLITHDHIKLLKRVRRNLVINLSNAEELFLQMLSEFYTHGRYDTFSTQSIGHEFCKKLLINFFEKQLNIKIRAELQTSTEIDEKMRSFVGDIMGGLSQKLYALAESIAIKLNIYTYEITYDSKAYKIFTCKDLSFNRERTLRKELLIAYLHKKFDDGLVDHISKINPIEFESHTPSEYIKYLIEIHPKEYLQEELEARYEDIAYDKERAASVAIIGTDISLEASDE